MNEGPKYAVEFQSKLMSVKCKIDVIVDLTTASGSAVISGLPFMGSRPGFSVTLDDLVRLQEAIAAIRKAVSLLKATVSGAGEQQINCQFGCAIFIAVKPKDAEARYSMNVGTIHREGELDSYDSHELDEAISQVQAMLVAVKAQVANLPH